MRPKGPGFNSAGFHALIEQLTSSSWFSIAVGLILIHDVYYEIEHISTKSSIKFTQVVNFYKVRYKQVFL